MSCSKSVFVLSAVTALCMSAIANPVVRLVKIGGEDCNFEVRVVGQSGDATGREVSPTDVIRCTIYPLPRLYKAYAHIDGKPVAIDEHGHFSGPAGETGLVVVSYAKKGAWYLDPVEKNRVVLNGTTCYTPWGGVLDEENGLYFAVVACNSYGGGESGVVQINAQELIESPADDQVPMNSTTKPYASVNETTRDISYSAKYRVVLSSGFSGDTNKVVAYPLGGDWQNMYDETNDVPTLEKRYYVSNDLGRRLWPAGFDHDSTYFYAVHSNGEPEPDSGTWVNDTYNASLGKFAPVEDGNGLLVGFHFIEDIVTDGLPTLTAGDGGMGSYVGVVRTFFDAANNREIVYVAGENGVTAVDTSTTPPTVVHNVFPNLPSYVETYPSLNVTGVSDGTPHLVLNRSTTGLSVYALMPDLMTLVSTEPIAAYTKADPHFAIMNFTGLAMGYCGFGATEDEKYLFFNAPHAGTAGNENVNITFHTFLFWNPKVTVPIKETILLFK